MLIAQEKKKNNIAEYVLYMWQIEDLIRANNFDLDSIQRNIINGFQETREMKEEIRAWYAGLIQMMRKEGIMQDGHLAFVNDVVEQLNKLHEKLKENPEEQKYREVYGWAKPNIEIFRNKITNTGANDIEVCFNALYGLLLLRLKKETVTEETTSAMTTFSNLLALLASKYKAAVN
ncbi:MAG TPA: DUF4924 family protein [Bacteroidales bacterium]|nr:DUF4924 family protein [Bacteroidales bacterium]